MLLVALRPLGDAPARSLTALAQRLGVSGADAAAVVDGPNPTRILVANSKMRVMILCTLASEGQSIRVDSYAETPDSVGESRMERIRHQYQQVCYQGQ